MKLIEALQIANEEFPPDIASRRVFLAAGFEPLHLSSFLLAHLRTEDPSVRYAVDVGLYGDLAGNIERAADVAPDAAAVLVEWQDLDPRLGIRQPGAWSQRHVADIVGSVDTRLDGLRANLTRLAAKSPVSIVGPTLPLSPFTHTATWELDRIEMALWEALGRFTSWATEQDRIKVLNPQHLDYRSPLADRFDVRSELATGFPYSTAHADALADQLAELLFPRVPKKGLITDLDNTLWRGILGEAGVEGISWDLDSKSQPHALYQRFVSSLAASGVLVGIATKNNPQTVQEALQRDDLLLAPDNVFPIEANWGRKSESVDRILQRWNVAADSVVFVDDSKLELDEVLTEHPGIECRLFDGDDPQAVWSLIGELRDLFGRSHLTPEDRVRLASLRRSAGLESRFAARGGAYEDFLSGAAAVITFAVVGSASDSRPLELVNKTNQFNLNGARVTDSEWQRYLREDDAFVLTASYEDKYGPLGRIAVLAGMRRDDRLDVDLYVMSCRAFGRHIEYQCLRQLFDRFDADRVVLRYQRTERNQPLREFFQSLGLDTASDGDVSIERDEFEGHCPTLHHRVETDLPRKTNE